MNALVKKEDHAAEIVAKATLVKIGDALQRLLDSRDSLVHEHFESQEDLKAFKAHTIPDQATLELTQAVTADLKASWKKLDERRKEVTGPLNDLLSLVNGIYKPLLTNKEAGETILKGLMAKALKRMQEEQTKALAAVAAATRTGDMQAAKRAMDSMPAAALPERMSIKPVWKFKAVDPTAIPEEYLMVVVNEGAVQAAIDAGLRTIPGFEIWDDASVTIRQERKKVG